MGRLSLSVGTENLSERGLKNGSFLKPLTFRNVNKIADHDQMPRSAVSDLDLHNFPMSQISQSRFNR